MASINTGDESGNGFLLVRRKNEWLNVFVKGGTVIAEWRQVDEMGRVLRKWMHEIDFDPRTRPWYKLVENRSDRAIHWTAPYGFVPTGDPGITAAVRVDASKEIVRSCLRYPSRESLGVCAENRGAWEWKRVRFDG